LSTGVKKKVERILDGSPLRFDESRYVKHIQKSVLIPPSGLMKGTCAINKCGLLVFAIILGMSLAELMSLIRGALSPKKKKKKRKEYMIRQLAARLGNADAVTTVFESIQKKLNSRDVNGKLDLSMSPAEMFFVAALCGLPLAILYCPDPNATAPIVECWVNKIEPNFVCSCVVYLANSHYELVLNSEIATPVSDHSPPARKYLELIEGSGVHLNNSTFQPNGQYRVTPLTGSCVVPSVVPSHVSLLGELSHVDGHSPLVVGNKPCSDAESLSRVGHAESGHLGGVCDSGHNDPAPAGECPSNAVEDCDPILPVPVEDPAPKPNRTIGEAVVDSVHGAAFMLGCAANNAPGTISTLASVTFELVTTVADGFMSGYNYSNKRRKREQ